MKIQAISIGACKSRCRANFTCSCWRYITKSKVSGKDLISYSCNQEHMSTSYFIKTFQKLFMVHRVTLLLVDNVLNRLVQSFGGIKGKKRYDSICKMSQRSVKIMAAAIEYLKKGSKIQLALMFKQQNEQRFQSSQTYLCHFIVQNI